MAEVIKIGKLAGTKDAFIINKDSIEHFVNFYNSSFKEAIQFNSNGYLLDNKEAGHFGVKCNEGDVIAFQKCEDKVNCPAGWNFWRMGTVEEQKEILTFVSDTEVYTKAVVREAIRLENITEAKHFMKERCSPKYLNEKVVFGSDYIVISTNWGTYTGFLGRCYVVCYGEDDFNILTLGTKSIDDYYVLDNHENVICELSKA